MKQENSTPEKLQEIFDNYHPRIILQIESGNLELKTATTTKELIEVFKMRQSIFSPQKKGMESSLYEFDEYDQIADHIIITDKETDTICGTYRMLCSEFTDTFYSQSEFQMNDFFQAPGVKLELGRACVTPEFRSGSTIAMLWRGLAHYTNKVAADYLFGCSSVGVTDSKDISRVFSYIKNEGYSDEFNISVLPKFKCQYEEDVSYQHEEIKKIIPPLLRTYFTCGAKVYGPPALDKEFSCIDLMTILDFKNLNQSFWNRFFR